VVQSGAQQVHKFVLFLKLRVFSDLRHIAKRYNFAGLVLEDQRLLSELEVLLGCFFSLRVFKFVKNGAFQVLVVLSKFGNAQPLVLLFFFKNCE